MAVLDSDGDDRSGSGASELPPPDPGAELMIAWQGGDEGAFESLVETYSGQVYSLLTRFLGHHPAREDLVQDVFLRVVRARDRYEPTARFTTWLYRIVFNMAVNEGERRRSREVSLDAGPSHSGGDDEQGPRDVADDSAPAPSGGLERADVVHAVRAAIAALPENQRMALVLAKYDEMPYAEIAHVLDSTPKAIKSLIHRARETLRETLAHLSPELMSGPTTRGGGA